VGLWSGVSKPFLIVLSWFPSDLDHAYNRAYGTSYAIHRYGRCHTTIILWPTCPHTKLEGLASSASHVLHVMNLVILSAYWMKGDNMAKRLIDWNQTRPDIYCCGGKRMATRRCRPAWRRRNASRKGCVYAWTAPNSPSFSSSTSRFTVAAAGAASSGLLLFRKIRAFLRCRGRWRWA